MPPLFGRTIAYASSPPDKKPYSTLSPRIKNSSGAPKGINRGATIAVYGRSDAPRCSFRSKAKVNCFLHALRSDYRYTSSPPESGRISKVSKVSKDRRVRRPESGVQRTEDGGSGRTGRTNKANRTNRKKRKLIKKK